MPYYENRSDKHRKFYRMDLTTIDLNGYRYFLVKTLRGRIGQQGKSVLYGYAEQEQAVKKMEQLRKLRIRHGYVKKVPRFEQLEFVF